MATLNVHNRSGEVLREKDLADSFTHAEVNTAVVHQCVVAYLANQRRGTASTKSRSEVAGSGRKLYRQKGTGRARVGDAGSPIRVHGGVAFGPKPRSYRQHTPKQVRRLGLKSALADRFQNEQCVLIEDFTLERPRTKEIVSVLNALNLEGKVLFILGEHNPNIYLSLRNIPQVNSCTWDMLNIYEVLWHDKLVITESAAEKLEAKFVHSEG
ncbi:MAG: 50S ribosomal protein L4 [Candidatus Poribacteria bacterium]|nr:50S ribosomal protein L4 [Candidatus Poribacteria bacterium]